MGGCAPLPHSELERLQGDLRHILELVERDGVGRADVEALDWEVVPERHDDGRPEERRGDD